MQPAGSRMLRGAHSHKRHGARAVTVRELYTKVSLFPPSGQGAQTCCCLPKVTCTAAPRHRRTGAPRHAAAPAASGAALQHARAVGRRRPRPDTCLGRDRVGWIPHHTFQWPPRHWRSSGHCRRHIHRLTTCPTTVVLALTTDTALAATVLAQHCRLHEYLPQRSMPRCLESNVRCSTVHPLRGGVPDDVPPVYALPRGLVVGLDGPHERLQRPLSEQPVHDRRLPGRLVGNDQ